MTAAKSTIVLIAFAVFGTLTALAQTQDSSPAAANQALLKKYCIGCHNNSLKTANVSLQDVDLTHPVSHAEVLEKVLRKVKSGQMPPAGLPRPDAATSASFTKWLESTLDANAAAHPDPGHPAIHRLNRAEYSNAIRDILALDIDAGDRLPVDDSGYGFDNIGDVLSVSSTLLDSYIAAARKTARLAIGDPSMKPVTDTYEPRREVAGNRPIPSRLEWVSEDLPFNSAGGLAVRHYFPLDAEYVFRVNTGNNAQGEKDNEKRIKISAGLHTFGVTFMRESLRPEIAPTGALPMLRGGAGAGRGGPQGPPMTLDLRLDGSSLGHRNLPAPPGALPRFTSVSISGPYDATGSGDTASRRKILICKPANASEETGCATRILAQMARHAYRRPVTDSDIRPLVAFYQKARTSESKPTTFEYGIQKALEAMLVAPDFLFRVEADPPSKLPSPPPHKVSNVELASRLSFFLWSSVPDDELLDLAEKGKLSDPAVLKQQVRRMLDDPKSEALTANFAGQWLHIRNLATARPDPIVFSDFDESLRSSMRKETELFFDSIVRENHPATDMLTANYTFLNDRLAKHYGYPNIYGSQFRRITLTDSNRGGLLGQGSLLTVTSPPNRTSVVERGKWILENLLGAPPPPPPADIPALDATTKGNKHLSLRAALETHRSSPSCSGCHAIMDPLGFALENYNGIGEWRAEDGGTPIDATGKLPDGTQFSGPSGLRQIMAGARRDEFVSTVTSKLLTYALGRGLEYYDQPTVRAILHQCEPGNYRMHDLITAIVLSTPFEMRRSVSQ